MSITVADCLKLPALREAKVLAGGAGLTRPVAALSVIEYPDIDALSQDLLVGNEILLSALVNIRDDVDAQCRLIHHLHSMGEAGLVLYYVGIYISRLDRKLMDTADQLGFPLIVMPYGRMDFRYSDAVAEVMELVITDRKQTQHYVSEMVNRISLLQAPFRTMTSVLRLLSDRLRCTLLLTDRYLTRKATAAWPAPSQWDYPQVLDTLKERSPEAGRPETGVFSGRRASVWDLPVTAQSRRDFHLFVLDERGEQDLGSLQQAAEVIELFLNIWNQDVDYEETDALVHAILNDQPEEKERIAARMHIDIKSIHAVWILHVTDQNGQEVDGNQRLACLRKLKLFLQEHHKLTIVDTYEKYLVSLADDMIFEEGELPTAREFAGLLKAEGLLVEGAVFQNVEDTAQAREAYLSTDANLGAARMVYPNHCIYTPGEIRFIQSCRDILALGDVAVRQRVSCLERLHTLHDREELFQTLETYLLDADTNVQRTGALLHLHKNTIKYRLQKIRTVLGCDLTQKPDFFEFYQAVALRRLLNLR